MCTQHLCCPSSMPAQCHIGQHWAMCASGNAGIRFLPYPPSRAAACHSATTCSRCLCGTARGTTFPLTCTPRMCKCSAGVAAEASHAMVCETVAKMTQMRHDNLAYALRLVVPACSCHSAAEPRYRALAGKKGMVECQRRCAIVAVLPRFELAAVDVVVVHASTKSYAAQAAMTAGWTAARAEQSKRPRFRKDVPDHAAFRFVLFAVETCRHMCKEAVMFANRLGDIAAESGRIPKGAFVRWAMRLLSVTVQRGNAEIPPECDRLLA